MIVFTGLVACVFFTVLAGWSWPTATATNLTHAVLDAIGKSLWLAWLVVAIGYLGNIPGTALVWSALFALLIAAIAFNRKKVIATTSYEMLAIATILGVVIVKMGLRFMHESHSYARIFIEWDALVSWNRWATELFVNAYAPVAAAYPLLFPGIWSLIYRAQGTADIWFIAKLSLFIVPIIVLLSHLLLWKSGRKLSAVAMALFSYWFFMRVQKHALFGGDMDSPVAILMLVFAILTIALLDAIEQRRDTHALPLLTTLAVFVGITAITKQAGFVCLGIFGALMMLLLAHKKIPLKKALMPLIIATTPLLTFYLMYASAGQSDIVGNLAYLSGLSETAAGENGVIAYAFHLLSERHGNLVMIALGTLSLLNLRRIRDIRGQLGIVMFAAAVAGFFMYAHCCAYHARNGWWVISLLAGSALVGITGRPTLDPYQRNPMVSAMRLLPALRVFGSLAAATLLASAIAGFLITDRAARAVQEKEQWTLVPPRLAALLQDTLNAMGPEDIIISPNQSIGWLPTMHGRYQMCGYNAPDCIAHHMRTNRLAYVLVHSSTKELQIVGSQSLLTRHAIIGTADGFVLYGPFRK